MYQASRATDVIGNNGLGAGLGVNGSISSQFLSDQCDVELRAMILDTVEEREY